MKITLGFKPKQSVKKLLLALPEMSRDIIIKRYGLGKNPDLMTLDAIGKSYGITRERVRQIENHAIAAIRKSKNYKFVNNKIIYTNDQVNNNLR